MTKNQDQMRGKMQEFYKRDVTEEEKVDSFLSLIMENPEDRDVNKQRWESVKDDPVFYQTKGAKRFGESFVSRFNTVGSHAV